MILPGNYVLSLILLVVSLVCLGSWANTLKATGKSWRFELYYLDFAVGAFIASLAVALTLGTLGWDGFSFVDNIVLAGKRQDVFAIAAGMVFNLGNMLIVAALSIGGMALAFPAGFGISLVAGAVWSTFLGPAGNTGFRFGGAAIMFAAAVVSIVAYRSVAMSNLVGLIRAGKVKSTRKNVSMKPVLLAIIGGIIAGSYAPLFQAGGDSEIGLGPYSEGFMFALGILISTFVFNLFFMNLPVQGEPVDMLDYFKGRATSHLAGLGGGFLWYLGMVSMFVCQNVPGAANPGAPLTTGLSEASIILAALWGILLWKEFASEDAKVNYLAVVMVVLMAGGVGLYSFGQIAPPH